MKLDDGRLTFVAQQEVTALDAIHKAVLGKAACAGRVTEGVGTCISIHAPTWGATVTGISERDIMSFQSTHPRGVRPAGMAQVPDDLIFQSTHPRGVRLNNLVDVKLHLCISIHAPTWGATVSPVLLSALASQFQSTHPRGVRRPPKCPSKCPPNISIHAPTWGATKMAMDNIAAPLFQSTHPRGVRQKSTTAEQVEMQFQSTHPRGVRHGWATTISTSGYFNPRTHVGCDC